MEHDAQPPTTPLIRGSAVHRGIGAGLLQQLRDHEPAPPDLMEDVAAAEIDRARHGGATLTSEERSIGAAGTFGRLKDTAVRYAGTYARQVAPVITPIAVERRITVAEVLPGIDLTGTLDVVTTDDQGELIRDAKTSGRAPRSNAADVSQQLTLYALLRSAEMRHDPATPIRVALDYLVETPATGAVTHRHLVSARGPRDLRAILHRIEAAVRTVEAGTFLPANPETDWWCSEQWCQYWSTCPYAFGPASRRSE